MYAIVEVGGMQWKVSNSDIIRVPKIEEEVGKAIELDRVLLVVDEDKVRIGKPVVSDITVKATILSHGKAEKVKVFKKKRRKSYRVLRGHRQEYTELKIDRISNAKEDTEKSVSAVKKGESKGKRTASKAEVKKSSSEKKKETEKKVTSKKAKKG